MANRYSLEEIGLITRNRVFFDANVLMFIFGVTGREREQREYASALSSLLEKQTELCVNFVVISEVINSMHRIEYSNYCFNKGKDITRFHYKKYRDSREGKKSLKEIFVTIEDQILKNFTVIENNITKADIISFLKVDRLDFNDKAILQCCKESDCILITNDKDFRSADIDIISAHHQY